MRVVVVDDFTASPVVREVSRPAPGSHEVLVRLDASGLCHTDIHAHVVTVPQGASAVLAGKVPARIVFEFASA